MRDAFIHQARDNTVSLLLTLNKVAAVKRRISFPVDFLPGTRHMTRETLRKLHMAAVAMGYRIRAMMWEG